MSILARLRDSMRGKGLHSCYAAAREKKGTSEETNLKPFRVVVFRRTQVIVLVALFVMTLVPLTLWLVYLSRDGIREARALRDELAQALDKTFDSLCAVAQAAASDPVAFGITTPSGSTVRPSGSGSIVIHWGPSPGKHNALADVAPVRRYFRLKDGRLYLAVSLPLRGDSASPRIIEVRQWFQEAVAGLRAEGAEFRTVTTAPRADDRLSFGSRVGAEILWHSLHPLAAASLVLSDNTGRPVVRIVATRHLTYPFHRALLDTIVLAAIALGSGLLFMREITIKAARVSEMWSKLSDALHAIAIGQLSGTLPPPTCQESAVAFKAVDELRRKLRGQKKLLANTAELQNYLAHTYQEGKLARAIWHYTKRLGIDCLEVYRIDSSRAHARRVFRGARNGFPEAEAILAVPEDCRAYRQAAPVLINDTHTDLICSHCVGPKDRSYLCIPLLGRGTAIGVLRMASRRPNFFDVEVRDIAETYAGMLATAMDNTYLFNELRQASLRDPLTGLHNRRFLEEYLAKRQAAIDREPKPVGIIMLDIDHFKNFNDTYGHDSGDQALRAVGSVIQRHLRAGDVACRFGGEEIVVVAEDADAEQTAEIAERLRRAIESEAIRLPQRIDPLRVTASAGVAAYPEHGVTLLDTLRAADAALYEAKRLGRNRVVIYAPSTASRDSAEDKNHPPAEAA